ncbi:putative nucleotidyltransferase substrate binding domain-containing protein [Pseudodesulfovibrio thermohalotolerans]|uniref:putative nucleotidyltransferase substrate binding domain-containing protein n=1 Tax=Pseudodesulfovibrio thermohalotolerans TaxID=2880651 RepID=UPI002441CB54|nr:putative nucleotidyltransferase substrate binding domain-containing protein [Pseudodesulfovibrio thermohalotolerans]WFS61241.1 putative nucleotidyltransferase substrate binding domain-containing protein [Pseudodesulfovibrio thermohalotolerans]
MILNGEMPVNGESGVPDGLFAELRVMAREGKLTGIGRTRLDLVGEWLDHGLSAEETCKRLTLFNREVTSAVLEAHALEYPWLSQCTFMEFGSGGRGEMVLGSDQDNGLLIPVEVKVDEAEVDDCTQSIVIALDGAGLSLCDGGVMVSNPEWRGDFDAWLSRLTGWLSNPAEKGPWQSGLILDFQPVFGAEEEVGRLRERLWEHVRTKPIALSLLVSELTVYRLPLTLFGAFITEREGPWHGWLNIKKSVLAHLTNSARILALKHGVRPHNTCDRIRALTGAGHIAANHGGSLLDGWEYLQRKRFDIGLDCDRAGLPPHNYVKPAILDRTEQIRLKAAIHAVEKLVRLVQAGSGL